MCFAAFSRGWEKDVVLLLVPYWEHSLFKAGRCHPRWGHFSWRRTSVVMSPKQSKSRWPTWCSQSENDFWDELKFWGVAAVTSLFSESSARRLSLFSCCCFCDHLIYCMHSGAWKGSNDFMVHCGIPQHYAQVMTLAPYGYWSLWMHSRPYCCDTIKTRWIKDLWSFKWSHWLGTEKCLAFCTLIDLVLTGTVTLVGVKDQSLSLFCLRWQLVKVLGSTGIFTCTAPAHNHFAVIISPILLRYHWCADVSVTALRAHCLLTLLAGYVRGRTCGLHLHRSPCAPSPWRASVSSLENPLSWSLSHAISCSARWRHLPYGPNAQDGGAWHGRYSRAASSPAPNQSSWKAVFKGPSHCSFITDEPTHSEYMLRGLVAHSFGQ